MGELPFVWEVEKNGAVSYLIGTAHYIDQDWLAQATRPYALKARRIFLEATEDFELEARHGRLPDNQTITDLLGKQEAWVLTRKVRRVFREIYFEDRVPQKLREATREKLWATALHVKKFALHKGANSPFYQYLLDLKRAEEIEAKTRESGGLHSLSGMERLTLLIESQTILERITEYDTSSGVRVVDHKIGEFAQGVKGKLKGLETPDEYTAIWDKVDLGVQQWKLELMIEAFLDGTLQSEAIDEGYTSGDQEKMHQAVSPKDEMTEKFLRQQVDTRTELWYPKTKRDIDKGKTLVCVGLGHIIREVGFISLLERDGFEVRKL